MTEETFNQLLDFFKVLGNESRLKILGLLAEEERSVGELATMLGLKEPTISHHLSLMKELGLVSVRAEGTSRIYKMDSSSLEVMNRDIFSRQNLASLISQADEGEANERMSFDAALFSEEEREILARYVVNGRITEIPGKNKRKIAVLRWLAEQFEPDRRYPEPEMNQLLKEYNEDHAALRRYLVDFGFMSREKGVYWREAS